MKNTLIALTATFLAASTTAQANEEENICNEWNEDSVVAYTEAPTNKNTKTLKALRLPSNLTGHNGADIQVLEGQKVTFCFLRKTRVSPEVLELQLREQFENIHLVDIVQSHGYLQVSLKVS